LAENACLQHLLESMASPSPSFMGLNHGSNLKITLTIPTYWRVDNNTSKPISIKNSARMDKSMYPAPILMGFINLDKGLITQSVRVYESSANTRTMPVGLNLGFNPLIRSRTIRINRTIRNASISQKPT